MANPSITGVFGQPFKEQVDFFRGKLDNLVPTERWTDMQKEAHDRAFTVAGATKAELLAELAKSVDKAVSEGMTIEQFRSEFADIVKRHGWQYKGGFNWRTRVIYDTNLQTSYAAGRLVQLQTLPWWVYIHSGKANFRPQHKAWNGLTLEKDDPWWRTHYPPNDWGCGCRVFGVRRPEDAGRFGGKVGPAPDDGINPKTGTPNGIGKGWDYMPGATRLPAAYGKDWFQPISQKLQTLPAPLGADLASIPQFQSKIKENYSDWLTRTRAGERLDPVLVGSLSAQDLKSLSANNIHPTSSEILLREGLVIGPKAQRHMKKGDALTDEWDILPELLKQPMGVALDPKSNHLIYFLSGDGDRSPQLAIEVGYAIGRQKTKVNMIVSAYRPRITDIKGRIKGGGLIFLRGKIE